MRRRVRSAELESAQGGVSAWESLSNGFFSGFGGNSNGSSMSSGMGLGGGRYAQGWSWIRDTASSAWDSTTGALGNGSSALQSFSNGFFGSGNSSGSSMSSGMGLGGGRYAEAASNISNWWNGDGASSTAGAPSMTDGMPWNNEFAGSAAPSPQPYSGNYSEFAPRGGNYGFGAFGEDPWYRGSNENNIPPFNFQNQPGTGSSDAAGSGNGSIPIWGDWNGQADPANAGPLYNNDAGGTGNPGYQYESWQGTPSNAYNYDGGQQQLLGNFGPDPNDPNLGAPFPNTYVQPTNDLDSGVGFGSGSGTSNTFNDRFNGDGSGNGLTPYGGYDPASLGSSSTDESGMISYGNSIGDVTAEEYGGGNQNFDGLGGGYQNSPSDQGVETDYASNFENNYGDGGGESFGGSEYA